MRGVGRRDKKSAAGGANRNRIMAGDDAESRLGATRKRFEVPLEIMDIGRETGLFLRNATDGIEEETGYE